MTPEEFLSKQTPEVRALAQRTREIIREANPAVIETVNPGRGNLAYGSGAKMGEWYCYIAPFKSYMNLGFCAALNCLTLMDCLKVPASSCVMSR